MEDKIKGLERRNTVCYIAIKARGERFGQGESDQPVSENADEGENREYLVSCNLKTTIIVMFKFL